MVNRPLSSKQKIQFLPDLFYCDVRTLIHTVLDIFFVLRCQEPVSGLAACFPPLFRQPVRRPFAHRICGYRAPLLPAPFAYPLPALPARLLFDSQKNPVGSTACSPRDFPLYLALTPPPEPPPELWTADRGSWWAFLRTGCPGACQWPPWRPCPLPGRKSPANSRCSPR